MDINTITDLNVLKAIAYDQVKTLTQAQQNLQIIEKRIVELQNLPQTKPEPSQPIPSPEVPTHKKPKV